MQVDTERMTVGYMDSLRVMLVDACLHSLPLPRCNFSSKQAPSWQADAKTHYLIPHQHAASNKGLET